MRVIKSLVLRTRDLIPTHLYSLLWVIRQQNMMEKYYFFIILYKIVTVSLLNRENLSGLATQSG